MKIAKWGLNILISIDQLFNTILGGDPDEVYSSRIGKLKLKYDGTIPWRRPFAKTIDYLLDKIDKNHSIDAIEYDEGSDAVLDKTKKRQLP